MSRSTLTNTGLADVSAVFANDVPRANIGGFSAGQLDNLQQSIFRARLSELFTNNEVRTIYSLAMDEFRKRAEEILVSEFGITGYVQSGRQIHKLVAQDQAYEMQLASQESPTIGIHERNDTRQSFPVDFYKTAGFVGGNRFVNPAITMERIMSETSKHLEGAYTLIRKVIRTAIYENLTKIRVDGVVDYSKELPERLTIYPYYNGDATLPIRSGHNDQNYFIPGTHTHYLNGDMGDPEFYASLIETVVHHKNPNVVLEIPQSLLPVIKTFTGRFTEALPDNTFVPGGFQPLLADYRLTSMDRAMRSSRGSYMAGYFDGYQVWVISHGLGNPQVAYVIARALLDGQDTNLYMRWSPVPKFDESDEEWTNRFSLDSAFPRPEIIWNRDNPSTPTMDVVSLIGCAPWRNDSLAVGVVEAAPALLTYVKPQTFGFIL